MIRGDVYWADLTPRSGSEQTGRRPAVILSDDAYNLNPRWMSLIVVPMSTSPRQARRGPTAVEIPASPGGLPKTGVAICHQITTVDRSKLLKRIGTLTPEMLDLIGKGVKAALDLD